MRYCRVHTQSGARWGLIENSDVVLLAGPPWQAVERTASSMALSRSRLLVPSEPSKIVCVGLNYRAHANEMGKPLPAEPRLFLKAPSALLDPGGAVILPSQSRAVEHEGELAVVIGRKASHVRAAEALQYVFGYTCLDDVSARDIQRREGVYARAKGFDTFCPVGPWVETDVENPNALDLSLLVNGTERQHACTSDMIFPVAELIAFVSDIMTLTPGDLIATGTPSGVGPLCAGDKVEIKISGIGTLEHSVTEAS